ncbi:toprim domain-containing protein [Cellulophaga sp. Hel_I_12]|uniref:toprim domain-containing protein n=1 Tax=Cellulophaga sp. Hel_I_12 TaxID=1249972 RepID=UPI0009DD8B6C|nr:toprim domain-containing protein [Cellulophaga sp. Hel_I_12]
MDKKRTTRLSCERARAFPIEKALAKLEHFPIRETEKEAWFLSPFRSETQASFKVSKKLNRWYDHGQGIGGNVIDLVCLLNNLSVKETLQWLEADQISFSFHQQSFFKEQNNMGLQILHAKPIWHFGLLKYLFERRISISTAAQLCKEVHFMNKQKRYFAIGLQNISGGWELRNKYCKSSTSPKDISYFKDGKDKLIITEGMFDMLSLIEIHKNLQEEYDFLILNSTTFIKRAMTHLEDYDEIDLYLDNDSNGKLTTENLLKVSNKFKDKSKLYEGFKDMNEWLMNCSKESMEQRIQDVFLLPQKQTCFSPDGCKENKK